MNRIIFAIAFILMAFSGNAKGKDGVEALFDGRYNRNPNATVTIVIGEMDNRLDVYKSLSLEDVTVRDVTDIEKAILEEARNLDNREMTYKGGRLYYAFLELPSSSRNKNRYVYYVNFQPKGRNRVLLIYMEGSVTGKEVKEMLTK